MSDEKWPDDVLEMYAQEELRLQRERDEPKVKLLEYNEPPGAAIFPALMVAAFVLLSLWGLVHGSNSYGRYIADAHDWMDSR